MAQLVITALTEAHNDWVLKPHLDFTYNSSHAEVVSPSKVIFTMSDVGW